MSAVLMPRELFSKLTSARLSLDENDANGVRVDIAEAQP